LTSGTGTGTVTCEKVRTGTGTVINYGSGTGTRYIVLRLPSFKNFLFIFYNKFVENYKLFPSTTAYCVKRQNIFQNFV
jgi:hypothetical protein